MKIKGRQLSFAAAVSIVALASPLSFGQIGDGEPGAGPNPYSNCGIGAALFPNTNWAAVTSNVIWDVGTTALTSATLSPETCQSKQAQTAQFIIDTYDSIVEQTAKGRGDHLTAMLNILGCQESNHSQILGEVRTSVAGQVSAPTYSDKQLIEKASDYYDALISASSNMCS